MKDTTLATSLDGEKIPLLETRLLLTFPSDEMRGLASTIPSFARSILEPLNFCVSLFEKRGVGLSTCLISVAAAPLVYDHYCYIFPSR